MAKEKLVVIKEADLTNNCPECFNQEIKLTFYQRHTYGRLYDRTTKDISHEIKCKKCDSTIYPVSWTEDIERVFDYYQKMLPPGRPAIRFTSLFYILTLLLIVLAAAGVYIFLEGIIEF